MGFFLLKRKQPNHRCCPAYKCITTASNTESFPTKLNDLNYICSSHKYRVTEGSRTCAIQMIKLCYVKPQLNYNLRSSTKYLLLDLPNKTKKTTGERKFFAAALTLWNALPDELRALGSLKPFMARLKAHYFRLACRL